MELLWTDPNPHPPSPELLRVGTGGSRVWNDVEPGKKGMVKG